MNPARGVAFKLISAALFAVMSALIRQLGARYPIGQVVFYRSVFAIIPVVLVYAWRGELAAIVRTERPLGQAGRGVLSIAGMFFNFGAVARLPLVESNAIAFSSPLFTVALAALVLNERVRIYRWSAVVIGFLGVLVVLSSFMRFAGRLPMRAPPFKPAGWRKANRHPRSCSIFRYAAHSPAWRLCHLAG